MHGSLPDSRSLEPIKKQSYYAEYKNEEELEETMRELGVPDDDYVAKYYHLNKFKYQNLPKDSEGKPIVDQNNSHNKMSYC